MASRTVLCSSLGLVFAAALAVASGQEIARRTVNDGNVVVEGVPEIPARVRQRLRPYENARGAVFEDWAADGRGLYITTRFAETDQLHFVAEPGGARRQLTFFDEPVADARRRPARVGLVFSMDAGGGEFYQLFLLDPENGDSRRLTDGESRNTSALWSDDGRRLAYHSTRRNGRSNDVWLMEVDEPASARLIVEAPDGSFWAPADWSRDGSRLLIQQYVSITDSRFHLLDLTSGEVDAVIGGGEPAAAFKAGRFDVSGSGIFLTTDHQGEFERLAHLDLATGRLEVLTEEIPWDVDSIELSDDGRRGAFKVNEGGIERLYLFDPASRDYRRVEGIPAGLIDSLRFSPDGRQLAMTLNTATTPSDVFTLELGDDPLDAGELVRWTYSEVGGLDTSRFVEPELIVYPTFDKVGGERRRIPAFVYLPPGEGPHPVIVYIHGGPESQFQPRFRSSVQMWLLELGAAVIAPNVRGSSGYGKEYVRLDNDYRREDSVKDIGALLDWIEKQGHLDGKRVAVYGGSYGGYMVLASLTHYSDRLVAGIESVGISNFVTFLENTQDYRRDLRRVEYGDERDPRMREFLERIAPSNNAHRISAPLLVAQGENDPRVPASEAEQIVREVRKAGYDVWYLSARNEGHGFKKKENRDLFNEVVALFLEQHLLGG